MDYEFYYEPGKTLVHPSLDRLTFLLDPSGVKIHLMTDGAYERSGLSPDNARIEPANRRGPEKLPIKAGGMEHDEALSQGRHHLTDFEWRACLRTKTRSNQPEELRPAPPLG